MTTKIIWVNIISGYELLPMLTFHYRGLCGNLTENAQDTCFDLSLYINNLRLQPHPPEVNELRTGLYISPGCGYGVGSVEHHPWTGDSCGFYLPFLGRSHGNDHFDCTRRWILFLQASSDLRLVLFRLCLNLLDMGCQVIRMEYHSQPKWLHSI